jgi:hypothetical protein
MMNSFKLLSSGGLKAAVLASVILAGGATGASATVTETYGAVGADTPNTAVICSGTTICNIGLDNFSTLTADNASSYVSSFNSIAGTASLGQSIGSAFYSNLVATPTGPYGGTPAASFFPDVIGAGSTNSAVLLTDSTYLPTVNYFGIYISALDKFNEIILQTATGNVVLNQADIYNAILGSGDNCYTNGSNPYCGNPSTTPGLTGVDNGEPFVYVNFFSTSNILGVELEETIADNNGSDFESSNYAIGYLNPLIISGNGIPEPSSIAIMMVALLGLGFAGRRFLRS